MAAKKKKPGTKPTAAKKKPAAAAAAAAKKKPAAAKVKKPAAKKPAAKKPAPPPKPISEEDEDEGSDEDGSIPEIRYSNTPHGTSWNTEQERWLRALCEKEGCGEWEGKAAMMNVKFNLKRTGNALYQKWTFSLAARIERANSGASKRQQKKGDEGSGGESPGKRGKHT